MPCEKCNCDFVSGEVIAQCNLCRHEFHPACTRIGSNQSFTKSKNKNWKCDTCDDSNSKEADDMVSQDKKWFLEALSSMEKKIIGSFDAKFDFMKESISSLTDTVSELGNKVKTIESDQVILNARCDTLQQADAERGGQVTELQRKLRDLEQHSRCANIEIVGIPKTLNENVTDILGNIAKAINVTFDKSHVSVAHRLRLFSTKKHAHPPIIVQFISRSTKENWLTAAKRKKRLTTKEVSPSLTEGAVYINDHLTPENKELLGRARRLFREGRISYAVYVNGKVLIKPKEGDNAIRVQELKDLDPYDGDNNNAK